MSEVTCVTRRHLKSQALAPFRCAREAWNYEVLNGGLVRPEAGRCEPLCYLTVSCINYVQFDSESTWEKVNENGLASYGISLSLSYMHARRCQLYGFAARLSQHQSTLKPAPPTINCASVRSCPETWICLFNVPKTAQYNEFIGFLLCIFYL